ncbi:MAG: FkbM family methyltransferase, partial [Magnetococcales bacterium]|nr:FkbM family methyltransferase [Magnetococcales bacterium]
MTLEEAEKLIYDSLREGKADTARHILEMILNVAGNQAEVKQLLVHVQPLLVLDNILTSLEKTRVRVSRSTQIEALRLYRDMLADEKYADPRRVERYGESFYSQNDEDGIIAEIFRRIGTTNCTFLEFGIDNGLECNTLLLTYKGWRGVWMDGNEQNIDFVRQKFKPLIDSGALRVQRQWITAETINDVITSLDLPREIDLLNIDIDGNDYHVFKSIDTLQPRVVIIEYNGKLPPPILAVQRYRAEARWDGSDYTGCSLASLTGLATRKGYQLVGCNITGSNAFFVRQDLCGDRFYTPATAEALFNPARYGLYYGGGLSEWTHRKL